MTKLAIAILALVLLPLSAAAFELKTVRVTPRIYTLVGDLGPRSYDNHALNNTMGFIVTGKGVVLIDSGASAQGAKLIERAIASVSKQPVKWVINTGTQDHRWLGNGYFAARGAQIIALARTVKAQKTYADSHMRRLKTLLRDRLAGTQPLYAQNPLAGNRAALVLGGIKLQIIWPGGGHFPDDAIIWVPSEKTVFTGDLVFHDRMLGIQSDGASVVRDWARSFKVMEALKPAHVVPGHGSPGDLARARRDTGDYLDWLLTNLEPAVNDMEDIGDVVKRLADAPFKYLKNYDGLHRKNVNLTYLQLEAE
ncbi:MAG TPA: MBL fold metallo-hydrolase [Rhizobiales bacterium]|nr:MBL fold metallo-hydrolase [Hyphomicrobiales bacterium]